MVWRGKEVVEINKNILKPIGLILIQDADKTDYIVRSINMVRLNIFVGGSFVILILLGGELRPALKEERGQRPRLRLPEGVGEL